MTVEEQLNKIYEELCSKYDFTGKDIKEVKMELPVEDYVLYLCHKVQKWLGIDKIFKVVNYYRELCTVIELNNVKIEELPECCQIIITATKYYVKGVYAVKRVYNL